MVSSINIKIFFNFVLYYLITIIFKSKHPHYNPGFSDPQPVKEIRYGLVYKWRILEVYRGLFIMIGLFTELITVFMAPPVRQSSLVPTM